MPLAIVWAVNKFHWYLWSAFHCFKNPRHQSRHCS